jgi:hypothetical protein
MLRDTLLVADVLRRKIAIALVLVLSLGAAAMAQGSPDVGEKDNGFSKLDERYLETYNEAAKEGFDVGRNLLESAWSEDQPVAESKIRASYERMDLWLNPPPPPPAPVPEPTATEAPVETTDTTTTSSYAPPPSSGGCPASLAGESGSPTAVNPSSGASGCIQALPSTWEAYGDPRYPSAADAPVSVQMEAMARICAAQGNDAWVAADPC